MTDQGSSPVIGSLILVGIVAVAWSGWLATQQPPDQATEATIPARPIANGSLDQTYAYELEVEHVWGSERADARIVIGNASIPWQLTKGATARVACPPPGVLVNVVIDGEVVAWTATPACDTRDHASMPTTSSDPPPRPDRCEIPIEAEAIVDPAGSATLGVTICETALEDVVE